MGNLPKALVSLAPSLVRLARWTVVKGHRKAPRKRLELYEAEYCPFCRHVRETLTELDLDALSFATIRRRCGCGDDAAYRRYATADRGGRRRQDAVFA
jgi:hypothetical protein